MKGCAAWSSLALLTILVKINSGFIAAVIELTKSLVVDFMADVFRYNAICPKIIGTPSSQEAEPVLAGLFRPFDLAKVKLSEFKFEH